MWECAVYGHLPDSASSREYEIGVWNTMNTHLASATITQSIGDGETLYLGMPNASRVELHYKDLTKSQMSRFKSASKRSFTTDNELHIFGRLDPEGNSTGWQFPIGIFYIDEVKSEMSSIGDYDVTVIGYDHIVRMSGVYTPRIQNFTVESVIDDILDQCGIDGVDNTSAVESVEISELKTGYSRKDVLSQMCQLNAAHSSSGYGAVPYIRYSYREVINASWNTERTFNLVPKLFLDKPKTISTSDYKITWNDQYLGGLKFLMGTDVNSDTDIVYNGICTGTKGHEIYAPSEMNGKNYVVFENPYFDSTDATNFVLYTGMSGWNPILTYTPVSIKYRPDFSAAKNISPYSLIYAYESWENLNLFKPVFGFKIGFTGFRTNKTIYTIPSSMTFNFDGGLSFELESCGTVGNPTPSFSNEGKGIASSPLIDELREEINGATDGVEEMIDDALATVNGSKGGYISMLNTGGTKDTDTIIISNAKLDSSDFTYVDVQGYDKQWVIRNSVATKSKGVTDVVRINKNGISISSGFDNISDKETVLGRYNTAITSEGISAGAINTGRLFCGTKSSKGTNYVEITTTGALTQYGTTDIPRVSCVNDYIKTETSAGNITFSHRDVKYDTYSNNWNDIMHITTFIGSGTSSQSYAYAGCICVEVSNINSPSSSDCKKSVVIGALKKRVSGDTGPINNNFMVKSAVEIGLKNIIFSLPVSFNMASRISFNDDATAGETPDDIRSTSGAVGTQWDFSGFMAKNQDRDIFELGIRGFIAENYNGSKWTKIGPRGFAVHHGQIGNTQVGYLGANDDNEMIIYSKGRTYRFTSDGLVVS